MKKIVAVIAAGAFLAAGAVAEITFSTWLRVQNALVASDGDDTYAGSENSWGSVRYARVNIAGQDEDGRVGFKMDIYDEAGTISRGDNAYLWVKPIEQIKVAAGKWDSSENWLRGDLCYGSWNWLRPYNYLAEDEGLTFTGANSGTGLHVQIWPMDGLQIYIGIPLDSGAISNGNEDDDSGYWWNGTAQATYISSQVAVAYRIEPIASTIKVQYVGNYADESGRGLDDGTSTGAIEVAFDFGMVENLYVTAGFRYRIMDDDLQAQWGSDTMKIAVGASYELGNVIGWDPGFKISASGGVMMYNGWDDDPWNSGYKQQEQDPRFWFGVGLDLGIIEGLKLEADVRYLAESSGKSWGAERGEDDSISFLIGLLYSVTSNGEIGIAFQGATNGCGFAADANWDRDLIGPDGDEFSWAIPLRIGVWL